MMLAIALIVIGICGVVVCVVVGYAFARFVRDYEIAVTKLPHYKAAIASVMEEAEVER